MNVLNHTPRWWRPVVAALVCTVAAVAEEPGLSISGDYDDGGTVIASDTAKPTDEISLHALLSLEFTPGLARLLHEATSRVRLVHRGASVEAQVFNRAGEVKWRWVWKEGDGYGLRDDTVILRYKPTQGGHDEYLLVLKTITTHRLLQIEVQRHTPTLLGPSVHQVGTYLFSRLPDESPSGKD